MDLSQLTGCETEVSSQLNRVRPELCRLIVSIHMDVGRLVGLMAVEIHPVWPDHQYSRHFLIISLKREPDSSFRNFVYD